MTTAPTRSRIVAALAVSALAAVAAVAAQQGSSTAATVAMGLAPTVIINEVNTVNLTGATDEKSARGDWVELLNTTAAAVDLSGWGLSNTAKSPFKWVFPQGTSIAANGYLRVWLDKADRTASVSNLHANFNVDNGVDPVVLSAPNNTPLGQQVDATTPPRSKPDVSWCRMPSGVAGTFTSCLAPTPNAANGGATAVGLLSTPTLSVASGVYPTAQSVTASLGTAAVDAGAELRYTTDGSLPTSTSPLVTGPITVSASQTLRVGAFRTGVQSSYAVTGTYVIDATGRYDGQRKIYVTMAPSDATSFRNGASAPAYGWRSAVELQQPDGTKAFASDAMTEQAGQLGSRNGQQTLPLEINFKDAVGFKNISYPLFSDKPTQTTYKKLRLRNAGDDYQEAHLRDQYWQAIGTEANLAPAAYEPVQVFVNGAYYGAMDLREKEDETLVESSYGVDKDTVEYMSDTRVVAGETTSADYDAAYTFVANNDLSVAANYAKAASLFDLENMAQDFAIHMFAADQDWQWRNVHAFAMPSYDGRWRYRIHDVDISSDGTNAWGYNTLTNVDMTSRGYGGYRQGYMMTRLIANPTFKALYANLIADQLNTVLKPSESQARLDAMAAELAPYIPNQVAKNGQPTSVAKWQTEVARLRTFLGAREQYYVPHTQTYLKLGARAAVSVGVTDASAGTVKVNTVDLSTRMTAASPTWTGQYWTGIPVTLTAKPKPGFAFAGWSDGVTTQTRTVDPGSGVTYTASFAALATVPAPTVTAPTLAASYLTGKVVSIPVAATDPNGYALTYSAKNLPNGLDLHPTTGLIWGKPTRAGAFASTITVTNGKTKATITVNWTVTNQLDRLVTLPVMVTGDGTGLASVWSADANNNGTLAVTRTEAPAVTVGTAAPFANYPTSNWSVRWVGFITAPVTGTYSLRAALNADDGARVMVDGATVIDAWTSGATAPTGSVALTAGVRTPITVEFWDKAGAANLALSWLVPGQTAYGPIDKGVLDPGTVAPMNLNAAWSADANNGGTLGVTRVEYPAVAVGSGGGPFTGYPTSNWSVRFTGFVTAPTTGTYALRATINGDDGARLVVGGVTVADAWTSGVTTPTGTVALTAGVKTPITIEFWDKAGAANLALSWLTPGATTYASIPATAFSPN